LFHIWIVRGSEGPRELLSYIKVRNLENFSPLLARISYLLDYSLDLILGKLSNWKIEVKVCPNNLKSRKQLFLG
jgi:hypothetical protein